MKIQVQLTHESVSNSKGLDKFPSLDPRMTSSRLMSTVVVKQAKLLFQEFLSLERINGWLFIVALSVLKLILKTALTKLPRKSLNRFMKTPFCRCVLVCEEYRYIYLQI